MVSLLIGVNNQYQGLPFAQYQEEFVNLLETAIALASGDTNRVFVVSIPDYYYTPFGQENRTSLVSREIDQYNEFAEETCDVYHIEYLNITRISRDGISQPNLVAEDKLHPSGSQYKRWVEEAIHHKVQSQFSN
jgi:lysophospholipase L1-like esterase